MQYEPKSMNIQTKSACEEVTEPTCKTRTHKNILDQLGLIRLEEENGRPAKDDKVAQTMDELNIQKQVPQKCSAG